MMYNPYSIGRTIYLRAPIIEDVEGRWHQWFSDPEITQYLGDQNWPNTIERQKQFFLATQDSQNRLVLSIVDKKTDVHIGVCNLSAINWVHRFADLALVIGEKPFRNGQTAIETISLLLDIAFMRLNLRNVKGNYMDTNLHSELLIKIFGFEITGRNKALTYFKGQYLDVINVQLSQDKWLERNPGKIGMHLRPEVADSVSE